MNDLGKIRAMTTLIAMGFAGQSAAHMYINFPNFDRSGHYERSKRESRAVMLEEDGGTFGPVRFNMQHACTHEEGAEQTTRQLAIVFPVGTTSRQVNTVLREPWAYPAFEPPYKEIGSAAPDADGNNWSMVWLKPQPAPSLPKAYSFSAGEVTSEGPVTNAVVWVGDHPDSMDVDVPVTMYLPDIPKESCVKEVHYFFAAAQFCTSDTNPKRSLTAWLLGTTPKWPKAHLGETSVQWAPTLVNARNLKTKPLPASCGGKGEIISVYPSREAIDQYLRPVLVDKSGHATQQHPNWWLNNGR